MRNFVVGAATLALVVAVSVPAEAGKVTVKNVHLCCGQCVREVNKTLGEVDKVADVACDRDAKTITFTAEDDASAKAGIKALSESGFYGTATHGDAKLDFPDSGAKKDAKGDKVVLSSVHLCCGQCVRAVNDLVKDVKSDIALKVAVDRTARTVTLTGQNISHTEAVAALNKGGFFAEIKSDE